MKITSNLFEAYLKCPTKCFLQSRGEAGEGNEYADWVRVQSKRYREDRIREFEAIAARDGQVTVAILTEDPKVADQEYVFDFVAETPELESHLHVIEWTPPNESDKPAQFVPTRFIYTNKINKHDKLLLGFDALVLTEVLGHEVRFSKIIHGDDHTTLRVNTSSVVKEIRQLIGKITNLLSNNSPPDLILNRHCAECEFKLRCRKTALESDDLSLLSAMTEKERSRHRSKGIFTVNQLSYTFRPRKAPKRAKNPAKPHYHALQALSLRENTVYVHGNPQLPMSDSKIFLDIEGLPDSDFYYLIGAFLITNGQESFHGFWADETFDEPNIFAQFVETVSALPDFRVYHFGDYETIALKRAKQKLPEHLRPTVDTILERSINVLSVVHPYLYFPTYSNGLKEIGRFLGFARTEEDATGLQTITWRKDWEARKDIRTRIKLTQYNQDDCIQLKRLCDFIASLNSTDFKTTASTPTIPNLARTEELNTARPRWKMFGSREYTIEDFKHVVKCSYFDYQREKVFIRTHQHFKTVNTHHRKHARTNTRPNAVVVLKCRSCPRCNSNRIDKIKEMSHTVMDLRFSKSGVKKWITRIDASRYHCQKCRHTFSSEIRGPNPRRYGHGLMSWCAYFNAVCGANLSKIRNSLGDLFQIFLDHSKIYQLKRYLTESYQTLYEEVLQTVVRDPILHIDETVVHFRGGTAGYVWVLTSMDKAVYLYKPSRETGFLAELLRPFTGVLISDFYTGYDSLNCVQQKCLVHLVRDIDDDLLRNPLNSELRTIASELGILLREIIQSVDRYGLRKRHLGKHKHRVSNFLQSITSNTYGTELGVKYKKRFQKGGTKMFTFLDYDGVPWNNNNAEHAIKRFAKHRREGDGRFTEKTLKEYLVLATVTETCEFNNVNVLKFLLSRNTSLSGLFKMARRKDHDRFHKPDGLPLLETEIQTQSSKIFSCVIPKNRVGR